MLASDKGSDALQTYEQKKALLQQQLRSKTKANAPISLRKKTSNLFRHRKHRANSIDVKSFNRIINIDRERQLATVEGMITYDELVSKTLEYQCLPTVVPELKSITIGGALAGVGIESSSFRYGAVHETIEEFEVLTGDGEVVLCRPDNEHRDLFFAFPNSYGTLGYALKITVKLIKVSPYVKLTHHHYSRSDDFFEALAKLCNHNHRDGPVAYIDGAVFSKNEFVLTQAEFVDQAPYLSNYQYMNIYYRSMQNKKGNCSHRVIPQPDHVIPGPDHVIPRLDRGIHNALRALARKTRLDSGFRHNDGRVVSEKEDYLTTSDYIWRWDADWFWCSKVFYMQNPILRALLGKWMLKSTVYWKLMGLAKRNRLLNALSEWFAKPSESVIQDVAIPIENAEQFLDFFQKNIGISPVWTCPIRAYDENNVFSLFEMNPKQLYVNFGFWGMVPTTQENGYYNRKIEEQVLALGGIKSLYSSCYYSKEQFWDIYNENLYGQLKAKYDPNGKLRDLYRKCTERV